MKTMARNMAARGILHDPVGRWVKDVVFGQLSGGHSANLKTRQQLHTARSTGTATIQTKPQAKVCLHPKRLQLPFKLHRPLPFMTVVLHHNNYLSYFIVIVLDDSFFHNQTVARLIVRQSMNKPSTVSIFRFCEACDEPG